MAEAATCEMSDAAAQIAGEVGAVRCAVVIPAYNAARHVRETVESVFGCGTPGIEVIIVDDGSTDDTPSILAALSRDHPSLLVVRQANSGVSLARNKGLDRVSAAFVCFLDADDRMKPGGLGRLTLALAENPGAAASYGSCTYIDDRGSAIILRGRHAPGGLSTVGVEDVLQHNFIDTPGAILFRTSVVRDVGGFAPGVTKGEDWELYTRISTRGAFTYCGASVLEYRLHESSAMRGGGFTVADLEPALRLVYGRSPEFYGVARGLMRVYEHRKRAGAIQLSIILGRGAAVQASRVKESVANLFRSGFDGKVLHLCLRSIASALRRL